MQEETESRKPAVRKGISFFSFLTSLLEYNCFTVVCQFLLYNKVNQLYVYIYPLPPSLSHPSRWSQSTELISLCHAAASHQLSIFHLVVHICPCHSLTSSQLTLPPPRVLNSITYSFQRKYIFIYFLEKNLAI